MLIRLFQASSTWILQAEGLVDPADWNRFLPAEAHSERAIFERTARELLPGGLTLRKNLLKPGLCVLEYGWGLGEDEVLEHAWEVAKALEAELSLDGKQAA